MYKYKDEVNLFAGYFFPVFYIAYLYGFDLQKL